MDTTELIALSPPDDPTPRRDVLHAERAAIGERRRRVYGDRAQDKKPLTGLAFSGGGIRSATFCLGVLEELEQRGVRPLFDYLSTVSGGGYVGSWWSAYLSRTPRDPERGLMNVVRAAVTGLVQDSPVLKACAPKLAAGTATPLETPAPGRLLFQSEFPRSPFEEQVAGEQASSREGRRQEDLTMRHLRLHSNYLIPSKGLSWDAWRAVTVISRNLLLTWAVLLPFLLAAVVACQAYFLAVSPALFTAPPQTVGAAVRMWWDAAAPPLLGILATLGLLTFAWLVFQGQRTRMPQIGTCATALLIAAVVTARQGPPLNPRVWQFTVAFALVALGLFASRSLATLRQAAPARTDPAVRRNQILFAQERLVALLVAASACLVAGGLAHLVGPLAANGGRELVATAGGWTAVLTALASAAYTVFKASPAGGADSFGGTHSRIQRAIFAAAPVLLLTVLVALAAHWSRTAIIAGGSDASLQHALFVATLLGVLLSWVYASHETSWHRLHLSRSKPLVVALVGVMAGAFAATVAQHFVSTPLMWVLLGFVVWCFDVLARRLGATVRSDEERQKAAVLEREVLQVRLIGVAAAAVTFTIGVAIDAAPRGPLIYDLAVLALVFSLALLALTVRLGLGQKAKAVYLVTYAVVVSAMLVLFGLSGWLPATPVLAGAVPGAPLLAVAAAIVATAAAWTLAFGWSTDPNNLSMHAFYRARLVRAYLGASNVERRSTHALIDDAVPGDDLELTALQNTSRGAPYHLVNATLNLSGDRSLGSVQRQAAPFIFSRLYCGGSQSGYRDTLRYMGGGMTLGTAVAISGAAASPNMGSQTPGAPLAMLMTLFNVRLGFWAPNPKEKAWRSRQARFWSFYTLKEFLSRTTDTASYCFLSDGGHFDNTGVYSLIERGCRVIVAVDCGADDRRTFADLGNMARRVRIDFDAEVDIDLADLGPADPKGCRNPFVVGTILYSPTHLRGIGDLAPEDTTGYLLLIKPSIVGHEPADVRQYGFQNTAFPQQSTADQFFDEAQFESYRRLGEHCAECALDALLPDTTADPDELLRGFVRNLRASVLRDDTPASADESPAHRIFQPLQKRVQQVLAARGLPLEVATEALVWNYLRRVSAAMLHAGRRRADDVEDAQFAVSQLIGRMAEGARRRNAAAIEEEDFIEARAYLIGTFPFTLLHGAPRAAADV